MSWKIGTTDFKTYGVYVARSSGILDKPAWQARNDGTDWIDQYGREYWQDIADIKKSDHDIILNCWITATSYADFKTKLDNFKTLTDTRDFTLTTPFCTVSHCYIPGGFTAVRETNYRASRQIGTFTLRIVVTGDRQEDTISVYPPTGGTTPKTTILTKNLKVYKRMQGDMYATCTTETSAPLTISRGDFIVIPVKGVYTDLYENFYLAIDPEVRKVGENKYSYNLRWEYGTYGLRQVTFKSMVTVTPEESDFYFYANVDEIVDKILANLNVVYPGLYVKGSIEATERRNHKFNGENCWDVLRRICSDYELEFDFVSTADVRHACTYTLDIATKIGRNWPFTLEYGVNNGLYDITRESVNKEDLCTSLYAWGSTKNLKADYGYRRLKCPTMPLQDHVATYGIVEKTVFFDDIYPKFEGTVEGYIQYPSVTGERATTGTEWEQTDLEIYRITDTGIDFDLNDKQYLTGLPAKVMFTGTSVLAGMEFEIKRYDATNHAVYFKPFVDEYAGKFPNATIYPAAGASGDTYTFIDINQPESYITTAEAELLAAAQAWLTGDETHSGYSTPAVTYSVTVDPAFIRYIIDAGYPSYAGFNVGDNVAVIDTDLSISDLFRVSEVTKDCYTGRYELKLYKGNPLTTREMMSVRMAAVERAQQAIKTDKAESQRKDQATTKEVETKILDPADDKIATDDVIRNESIDSRHLAYDAIVPNVYIDGIMITLNYKGRVNEVSVTAGKIVITNWANEVKNRFDLQRLLQSAQPYSPRREWTIAASRYVLPSPSESYYVYAKLPLPEPEYTGDPNGTATLVYLTERKEVKELLYEDDGYLMYQLGVIKQAESPRQGEFLWGNLTIPDPQTMTQNLTGVPQYGYLYDEYALTDARNIANDGWRVMTTDDFSFIQAFASGDTPGSDFSGLNLKSTNVDFWASGSDNNSDSYGFDIVGAGTRDASGTFSGINQLCYLGVSGDDALYFEDGVSTTSVVTIGALQARTVRLVNEATTLTATGQTGWYTGNDGRRYMTVYIGTSGEGYEITSQNLCETRFRDHTQIPECTGATAWAGLTTPAWCTYNNDSASAFTEGELQEWAEAVAETVLSDSSFLDLSDTPDSYSGNIGKFVIVASGGDSLMFGDGMAVLRTEAVTSGEIVTVDNTNNVIKLTGAASGATGDTSGVTVYLGSIAGYKYWEGSQAEYEGLTPSADTLYFITE